MVQDIRWEQRFSNFAKALEKLSQAVEYIRKKATADENDNGNIDVLDEMQ